MNTKKFNLALLGAHSYSRLEVIVSVETDNATHECRRVFDKDGTTATWPQAGRTYTPDQEAHVVTFVDFYVDTIRQKISEYLVQHSFDKTDGDISLRMDAQFRVTDFHYRAD